MGEAAFPGNSTVSRGRIEQYRFLHVLLLSRSSRRSMSLHIFFHLKIISYCFFAPVENTNTVRNCEREYQFLNKFSKQDLKQL